MHQTYFYFVDTDTGEGLSIRRHIVTSARTFQKCRVLPELVPRLTGTATGHT